MKSVSCYLCKSRMRRVLNKLGYHIYKCPDCGLMQTEFRDTYDEFVRRFYTKGYFTGDPRFGAFAQYEEDKVCIQRNTAQALRRIRKIKKNGTLLDVGCAMGFFVEQAKKAGFDAYGFDPSDYAVKKASKRQPGKISRATVGTAVYKPKQFDVITMFDVFEHLADPVGDIKKLKKFLKDDGILVIATGNTGSLAAKLLGYHWTFFSPPQHLFFFNRPTITSTIERAGYTPEKWFIVNKWLSLGYILHLAHAAGDYPFAEYVLGLVKRLPVRKLPLPVPMRDNMVVIARKA